MDRGGRRAGPVEVGAISILLDEVGRQSKLVSRRIACAFLYTQSVSQGLRSILMVTLVVGGLVTALAALLWWTKPACYDHFAPWAPIETVLNIWPYQLPTGFVKRPAAVHLHEAELEALIQEATRPPEARPFVRWVHFNVPHVPWLRDTGPFAYRAFLNTRDRYFKQLAEVDRALGAVLDSLKARGDLDRTTIVVTSDHGSRQGHAGADYRHVPLVVYSPGGTRQDIYEPVQVADVLKGVVAGACRAAQ